VCDDLKYFQKFSAIFLKSGRKKKLPGFIGIFSPRISRSEFKMGTGDNIIGAFLHRGKDMIKVPPRNSAAHLA